MDEKTFWDLIDRSLVESNGDTELKVKSIKSSLSMLCESDICDFERILRQKIIEADHYSVVAAAKIVDGYVSDDSYLYFRCWLIGQGKEFFEDVLLSPDSLAKKLKNGDVVDFEELLYASTEVFSIITGKVEDESFPREVCIAEGLDYDFNAPPTKGEDWEEEHLSNLLPKLWRRFNS